MTSFKSPDQHASDAEKLARWADLEGRLAEEFKGRSGVIGGDRLAPLIHDERQYGDFFTTTFRGHDIVENAFFEFAVETLQMVPEFAFRGQLKKDDREYAVLFATYLSAFRLGRQASVLAHAGYPLGGFSVLREVRARSFQLAATALGTINILSVHGVDQSPPTWPVRSRGLRQGSREAEVSPRTSHGRDGRQALRFGPG